MFTIYTCKRILLSSKGELRALASLASTSPFHKWAGHVTGPFFMPITLQADCFQPGAYGIQKQR
jgi:hypothetical protein